MKGKYLIIEVKDRRINRAVVTTKDENNKIIPVDSYKFVPGINFVPHETFANIEKSLKLKFDDKVYKKLHVDAESKAKYECSVDFHKLTAAQAESLVKDIYSVSVLEDLKKDENRDSVRAAIMNQIDSMLDYNKRKKSKIR